MSYMSGSPAVVIFFKKNHKLDGNLILFFCKHFPLSIHNVVHDYNIDYNFKV